MDTVEGAGEACLEKDKFACWFLNFAFWVCFSLFCFWWYENYEISLKMQYSCIWNAYGKTR